MHDRLAAIQKNPVKSIPLVDLQAQRRRLGARIDDAILRVCDHANFIMSGEVTEFERRLAGFCGARHAVACSNGTTALHLALLSMAVTPGDEIIVPTLTFVASVNAIRYCGATPVLVDSEALTMNLDPDGIEKRINSRTKGIIVVHLYGHPVDMDPILDIARRHGLFVV